MKKRNETIRVFISIFTSIIFKTYNINFIFDTSVSKNLFDLFSFPLNFAVFVLCFVFLLLYIRLCMFKSETLIILVNEKDIGKLMQK